MRLTELVGDRLDIVESASPRSLDITGLTADSREVQPGYLFAALPGTRTDGRHFVEQAIERGAIAVLAPPDVDLNNDGSDKQVALITDPNPRRRLALLASRFFERQPRVAAAVTGTNGKTSVAWFTQQIWSKLGRRAASIGTLGVVLPDRDREAGLTTPDPVGLHRSLAALTDDGVDHLVVEASSHGLAQYRLDGVVFRAGAFTNISRDHLDYHGSMDEYRAAKFRLFDSVLPDNSAAVLNADTEDYSALAALSRSRGCRVIDYGESGTEIKIRSVTTSPKGQRIDVDLFGERRDIEIGLPGHFQATNMLCALGLAVACGEDPKAVCDSLPLIDGVPGRLQFAGAGPGGAPVYVDYAHTPDALANVLTSIRPHVEGRLIVVFGCGGDRDPGKRSMMGEVARVLADRAIVTDDNPRSEDPERIRAEIMAACPNAIEIGDRREAIRTGVAELEAGDVLVVAGKGHETGQIVGSEIRPFDDVLVAREAVDLALGGRA